MHHALHRGCKDQINQNLTTPTATPSPPPAQSEHFKQAPKLPLAPIQQKVLHPNNTRGHLITTNQSHQKHFYQRKGSSVIGE